MVVRWVRWTAIGFDIFAAVSAAVGFVGILSGGLQMPLSMLEGSWFSDFTVPALILGIVVGGSAAAAAVSLWRGWAVGPLASVLAGVVMMGWIVSEILIIREYSWAQGLYFACGIVQAGLGLLLLGGGRRDLLASLHG